MVAHLLPKQGVGGPNPLFRSLGTAEAMGGRYRNLAAAWCCKVGSPQFFPGWSNGSDAGL